MATSNSRDVKMTLSVDTLGEDGILKLQRSVAALAKEGGDAAPEFQQLADEIGRLGEQAAALQAFQQLAATTGALAAQQEQAAASASKLGADLDALTAASQTAQANQQKVATSLTEAKEAANTTRDALARLTAMTAEAKRADEGYAASVSELKLRKIEQRAEIERLSAAMQAANAGVAKAEDAEGRLSVAYKRASDAATAAASALRANEAAVGEAAAAAQELGASTDNVAATQAALMQGLNQAGTAAQTLDAKITQLAAKERELADQKSFEKQLEDARRLVVASEYATLFDEALTRLSTTQKALQGQSAADKWQREAFALVEAAESTKKLAHEADLLSAVEKELSAQAAFEKQATDARSLLQAGEYVRFWREELDKAEQQAARTAQEAKAAAQRIDDAFRTLGVRSAASLRAEITQVREAMETVRTKATGTGDSLSGAFAAGEAKIKSLEREIRKVEGALTTADKASALFANSLGQIAAGNIIADGVGYLVNKVKELGRAFLDAVVQGDQMRRGLTAVYGDARIAAQQIDFLRKSSSESGVAFGALGQEFVKFSASMKLANIPMEQSNALFKSLTAASATLGLGTEATSGALNALGQMASKGTVSLEELRGQIGDRLPGALGLAAKGLGITEAQLIKLVESGQLATRDFIEPFTAALNTMKGEVDGIVPSWDRFKGLLSETAQNAGDSGWTQVLNLGIKVLGGTVGVFALGLSALSEALFVVVKGAAALALAFTEPKAALELMTEAVEQSRRRLTSQAAALNSLIEPTAAVASATTATAAAMTVGTAAAVKAINANTQLDAVQKLTALSAALAADATLSAAAKSVQYTAASVALRDAQAAQTDAFEKAAKAAKTQGDTLVELARLTGNHMEIQKASLLAAEMHAAALDKVAVSQSAETAMLVAQKAELIANSEKRGITSEQIKVQVDALDKLIVKSKAETEQAKQSSAAANQTLFERKLQIELLKDHSTQIDAFKKKVDEAAATLRQYEIQAAQGKKTEQEVLQARQELTRATALYRDALTDVISKTDLDTKAKIANLNLTVAQTTSSEKHYESLARQARAVGDLGLAQYYEIEAKKAAIKVLETKLKIEELQYAADILKLEMERKLIDGTTEEGRAQLKLLDIKLLILKSRREESQAIRDQIKEMETEVQNLRNGTGAKNDNKNSREANTQAINKETSALERQNEAQQRANAAVEKAIELENKRRGVDKDGFSTDKSGQKIVGGSTLKSATGIMNFLREAGIDDAAEVKRITEKYLDADGTVTYANNRGQLEYGGDTVSMSLLHAAEQYTLHGGKERVKRENEERAKYLAGLPGGAQAAAATAATGTPTGTSSGGGTTITHKFEIDGKTTAVGVASESDSANLTSVIRQLQSARLSANG